MRRRQLKWLWKRLQELQGMKLRREDLLMKLGAARQQAPRVWRLVEIEVDATQAMFTYRLRSWPRKRQRHFISFAICLNFGCSAVSKSSKRVISVEEILAPSAANL